MRSDQNWGVSMVGQGQDFWNRTSGKKVPFWAFGVGHHVGKRKNNASGKIVLFGWFMVAHIVPKTSPCFDKFPIVSHVLGFSHAMFAMFYTVISSFFVFWWCFPKTHHTQPTAQNRQQKTQHTVHSTRHLFGAHFGWLWRLFPAKPSWSEAVWLGCL